MNYDDLRDAALHDIDNALPRPPGTTVLEAIKHLRTQVERHNDLAQRYAAAMERGDELLRERDEWVRVAHRRGDALIAANSAMPSQAEMRCLDACIMDAYRSTNVELHDQARIAVKAWLRLSKHLNPPKDLPL